jgi:hypothetical protein
VFRGDVLELFELVSVGKEHTEAVERLEVSFSRFIAPLPIVLAENFRLV